MFEISAAVQIVAAQMTAPLLVTTPTFLEATARSWTALVDSALADSKLARAAFKSATSEEESGNPLRTDLNVEAELITLVAWVTVAVPDAMVDVVACATGETGVAAPPLPPVKAAMTATPATVPKTTFLEIPPLAAAVAALAPAPVCWACEYSCALDKRQAVRMREDFFMFITSWIKNRCHHLIIIIVIFVM